MNKSLGGMAFRPGRPIHIPPPPEQLPAFPIRLVCPDSDRLTVNQTVQQGQLLTDLDDASHPGVICPIDGTITNLTPIDSDLAGTRPHQAIPPR